MVANMIIRSYWTPQYIFNRISEMFYRKLHLYHPWLTKTANNILQYLLKNSDVGLEFGAGRSTIWFARRISFLTSVEHNLLWFNYVDDKLKKEHIKNVRLIYAPENEIIDNVPLYVSIIDTLDDNSIDFALVDGIFRSACAIAVLNKIRPGGYLIIDNVNWYLPSNSRSPGSRSPQEGPLDAGWAEILRLIHDWRCIWTTDGVSDTAFFFKPCNSDI